MMFDKAVHNFTKPKRSFGNCKIKFFDLQNTFRCTLLIMIAMFVMVGCSKVSGGEIEEVAPDKEVLYENPEFGLRIVEIEGWELEKETANSVKFKKDKIVSIITVIPKGDTVAEIKQGFLSAAGSVTVTGEGPNFISWKSDRNESIHTNIFIEEKHDRNIITTFLTPYNDYESNREEIEAFRWNTETY